MRNISFALTTDQIMEGTKTVTRRLGWINLKPGQLLQPVKKCMGLKKGEQLDKLRDPIQVVSVRREPLQAMLDDWDYGEIECELEGFDYKHPAGNPLGFVAMFFRTHKGCTPDTVITRIEFTFKPEPCDFCLAFHPFHDSCKCARCGCGLHPEFIRCVTVNGERKTWCPRCYDKFSKC